MPLNCSCSFLLVAPPRGERGLKYLISPQAAQGKTVAPPRGERGLKYVDIKRGYIPKRVAPPRGERGLKYVFAAHHGRGQPSRSPSWGAWIEMCRPCCGCPLRCSRSPSWGAWIEIIIHARRGFEIAGRSPSWGAWIEIRPMAPYPRRWYCRSPSWGAWIEICSRTKRSVPFCVAPPRGERGLKCEIKLWCGQQRRSLPLVGSVD